MLSGLRRRPSKSPYGFPLSANWPCGFFFLKCRLYWDITSFTGVRPLTVKAPVSRSALSDILGKITVFRRVASSREAEVYYVECTAYFFPVCVKIFLHPETLAPSETLAELHYNSLQRLWTITAKSAEFGAAQPLLLSVKHCAIVSEWLQGERLSKFLRTGSAFRVISKAGAWLSYLHRSGKIMEQPLPVRAKLARMDEMTGGSRRSPGVEMDAVALLKRIGSRLETIPVPWSPVHGDFKPDNLIFAKGKVFGLDMAPEHHDPCMSDVAQFLNHVDMQMFSFGFQNPSIRRRAQSAFLEGYAGQGGAQLSLEPLYWVRLDNALRLLSKARSWSSPPIVWYTQWCLRSLIRDLSFTLCELAGGAI